MTIYSQDYFPAGFQGLLLAVHKGYLYPFASHVHTSAGIGGAALAGPTACAFYVLLQVSLLQ